VGTGQLKLRGGALRRGALLAANPNVPLHPSSALKHPSIPLSRAKPTHQPDLIQLVLRQHRRLRRGQHQPGGNHRLWRRGPRCRGRRPHGAHQAHGCRRRPLSQPLLRQLLPVRRALPSEAAGVGGRGGCLLLLLLLPLFVLVDKALRQLLRLRNGGCGRGPSVLLLLLLGRRPPADLLRG